MIHLQLLEKSYLVIYSNQDSISLCLKSCKVCLNGAVRAFHLAAQGPYPCCKGQLSNAWTVREITKLTQLEPSLGWLPGLQGQPACTRPESYWLPLRWHSCDGSVGHLMTGWRWGEAKVSCSQVPQKGTQALPAAVGGKELACAGASRAERSTGAQGFRRQSAIQDQAGLRGWVSCYLAALSPALEMGWRGQDSYLKMCRIRHFWTICPSRGKKKTPRTLKMYNILCPVQVKDLDAVLQCKSIRTHLWVFQGTDNDAKQIQAQFSDAARSLLLRRKV